MVLDIGALPEENTSGVSSSNSVGGTATAAVAPDTSGGGGSPASAGRGSSTEPVVSDLSDSSGDEDLLRQVIHNSSTAAVPSYDECRMLKLAASIHSSDCCCVPPLTQRVSLGSRLQS